MFRMMLVAICCFFITDQSSANPPSETLELRDAIVRLVDDVAIPSTVSGVIKDLAVREGERITQGQMLAAVNASAVRLQVEAAQIELETAQRKANNQLDILETEKSAAVAKAELDRVTDANRKTPNTFLSGEVDRYRLLFERAELNVSRAKHEKTLTEMEVKQAANRLAAAEQLLAKHQIISPCDGIISQINNHVGEWVEPGLTVIQIVDIQRLKLEGFATAERAEIALIGRKVEMQLYRVGRSDRSLDSRDLEPDQNTKESVRIVGAITFVSPEVNPVDSTARITVEFDNANLRYRPGEKYHAVLTIADSEDLN